MTTDNTYPTMTATYSAEDNKLRLYSLSRLSAELYARVKAAGFSWAPKQEVFVAPMWTPARADLLIELCDEIGDEDTSMAERAEQRAERFDGYRDNRTADAESARAAVARIADGIPLGQPILIGHHSQRHAERDAKKIENGMRKAVQMWDTADYWKRRAAGALAHADYKADPAVRHRRIKGLESDLRKAEKNCENAAGYVRVWSKIPRMAWDDQTRIATYLAGRARGGDYLENGERKSVYGELSAGRMHGDRAWRLSVELAEQTLARCERWRDHYANRIAYERAMLGEGGGLAADRFAIEVGGSVLVRREWLGVLRVNRKAGAIVSVSTTGRYTPVYGIEKIEDYRAPDPEKAAAVAAALKAPPMCNYPGEGFVSMTKAEWQGTHADYKGSRELGVGAALNRWASEHTAEQLATAAAGMARHRVRSVVRASKLQCVYLTDEKLKHPGNVGDEAKKPRRSIKPKADRDEGERIPDETPAARVPLSTLFPTEREERPARTEPAAAPSAEDAEYKAMREALKNGTAVQAFSAPQLFPTPPELAARMVEEAQLSDGDRILEPSAGTGRLLDAIIAADRTGVIVAVEIARPLADSLNQRYGYDAPPTPGRHCEVLCADFVGAPLAIGRFDRVIMNPPFADGQDVAHVSRAFDYLAPGGRLVAILSSGVTFRSDRKTVEFRRRIEAMGGTFEPLPADSFASSGTGVNTVLLVVDAPEHCRASETGQEAAA